jgi:hypothetical protein
MDLETVSQYNPPTEPRGQERRIGRPDTTVVGGALDDVPAGIQGSVDLPGAAPIVINAGNHTLRAKIASAASFTVITITDASYATAELLVAAVNTAIIASGLDAEVRLDDTSTYLVLQSGVPGPASYIEIDTIANGSTFNAVPGFTDGDSFTVPSVAAVITATLPVGGPLDVSDATLISTLGEGATEAQRDAVADTIAPHIVDTDVAIKSFQVGMISGFRSASYNPDPNRIPALSNGAAVTVVQDDGVSAFTAPLTVISGAVHNVPSAGDISIAGTNLGDPEVQATVVRVTSANGGTYVKLYQAVIVSAGGSVSATAIVIPASLLNGLGVAGSTVRVQYTSLASNLFTVT